MYIERDILKCFKERIGDKMENALNEISNIKTEFMESENNNSILLYDFEDKSYINDIESILKEYSIKYKINNNEVTIFKAV